MTGAGRLEVLRGRSLRTELWRRTCSPGLRERRRARCRGPCGLCSTRPGLGEAPDAARPAECSSARRGGGCDPGGGVPEEQTEVLPTLSPARTLKEAMTWSAVSVSAVSRDMKSMKAWKVTMPILLGSTRLMMRENSLSPWWREREPQLPRHKRSRFTRLRTKAAKESYKSGGKKNKKCCVKSSYHFLLVWLITHKQTFVLVTGFTRL